MRAVYVLISVALTVPLTGCPTKDKNQGNDDTPPSLTHDHVRYLPTGTGDRWVYKTSSSFGEGGLTYAGEALSQVFGNATLNGVDTVRLTTPLGIDWAMAVARYMRITTQGLWEHFPPDSPMSRLQMLRFPLVAGDHFVAFSETNEGSVEDLDEDGRPESSEARITVTVIGQESVSTPAGVFTDAWKINRRAEWLTHYSTGHTSGTTSTVDEWLAKDMGLVRRDATISFVGGPGSTPVLHRQYHALARYFVNGVRSETTPPQAKELSPAADSTHPAGVATLVTIDFDELMDTASMHGDAIVLRDESGTRVAGEVKTFPNSLMFQPESALPPGNYTARVEGLTDALGTEMSPYDWTFRVVSVEDCYEEEVYVCSLP